MSDYEVRVWWQISVLDYLQRGPNALVPADQLIFLADHNYIAGVDQIQLRNSSFIFFVCLFFNYVCMSVGLLKDYVC